MFSAESLKSKHLLIQRDCCKQGPNKHLLCPGLAPEFPKTGGRSSNLYYKDSCIFCSQPPLPVQADCTAAASWELFKIPKADENHPSLPMLLSRGGGEGEAAPDPARQSRDWAQLGKEEWQQGTWRVVLPTMPSPGTGMGKGKGKGNPPAIPAALVYVSH